MFKRKLTWIILVLLILAIPAVVAANQYEENVVVPASDVVSDNFVAFGSTITIAGTVEGDAILFGGTVVIEEYAVIKGDLISGATTIDIDGTIEGNVRVGSTNLTINGSVGKNVSSAATTLQLGSKGMIGWSLQYVGGNANLLGTVSGHVTLFSNNATIDGTVGGNVTTTLEELTVNDSADISGDVTVKGKNDPIISSSATIGGTVTLESAGEFLEDFEDTFRTIQIVWMFISAAGLLLTGLVLVLVCPKKSPRVVEAMMENPLKHIVLGLVYLIVTPIAAGILMITLVGIPVGLILLAFYGIFIYLSFVFAGWFLGRWLLSLIKAGNKLPNIAVMAIGVVIFILLSWIPWFGGLLVFVGMIWGLGAIVNARIIPYFRPPKKKET